MKSSAVLSSSSVASVSDGVDGDDGGDDDGRIRQASQCQCHHHQHHATHRSSAHTTQKHTGGCDSCHCQSPLSSAGPYCSESNIGSTGHAVRGHSSARSAMRRAPSGAHQQQNSECPAANSPRLLQVDTTFQCTYVVDHENSEGASYSTHVRSLPYLAEAKDEPHRSVHTRAASRISSADPMAPKDMAKKRRRTPSTITAAAVAETMTCRHDDNDDDAARSSTGPLCPTTLSHSAAPLTPTSHSQRSPTPLDLTAVPRWQCPPASRTRSVEEEEEEESDRARGRSPVATLTPPQRQRSASPPLVLPKQLQQQEEGDEAEPPSARRLCLSGSLDVRSGSEDTTKGVVVVAVVETRAMRSPLMAADADVPIHAAPSPLVPPAPPPPQLLALTRPTSPHSPTGKHGGANLHRSPSPRPVRVATRAAGAPNGKAADSDTDAPPLPGLDSYLLRAAPTTCTDAAAVGGEGRGRPFRVLRHRWDTTLDGGDKDKEDDPRGSPPPVGRDARWHVEGSERNPAAFAAYYPKPYAHLRRCSTPPPPLLPSLTTFPTTTAVPCTGSCVPQVVPTHDSVFFPLGTDVLAPVMLHYVTVGGWSTSAGGGDYFSHRRLRGGEVAGHTVRWLHTAQPRSKFVFLVSPVERCAAPPAEEGGKEVTQSRLGCDGGEGSTRRHPWGVWQRLRRVLFGEAPWYRSRRPGHGPRSRIACDNAAALTASESDSDTGSGPLTATVSETYGPSSPSHRPLHAATQPPNQDAFPPLGADAERGRSESSGPCTSRRGGVSLAEDNASPLQLQRARLTHSVEAVSLPCSMSPKLVARQPSLSSASANRLPTGVAAMAPRSASCPTPLFLDVGQEGSGLRRSAAGESTPTTASAPLFPFAPRTQLSSRGVEESPPRRSFTPSGLRRVRRRGSGGSMPHPFLFSPLTGTAVTTSGVSPVIPHHSRGGQLAAQRQCSTSSHSVCVQTPLQSPQSAADGVEVIEVEHADVTAMDYAPRLTSHRLSLEAKAVHTYFFPSLVDALNHYHCAQALPLMEEQWVAGMTSQIPQPQGSDGSAAARRQQQQQQRVSVQHRSSSSSARTTSPATILPTREQSAVSMSLASALRVAGSDGDADDGGPHTAAFAAAAPTRLAQLSSLPSLSADAMGNTPVAAVGSEASLTSLAAHMATQSTPQPPAMPAWVRRSSRGVSAPPSPSFGRGNVSLSPPPPLPPLPVQPHLTSTHHEIVVSVYTADPVFNSVLREVLMPEPGTHPYTSSVAEQKRLLSMVEVGMPAWAVFYSSTGLPYRRLFRLLYSGLTNLWPLVSLAVGVYDLYKHLPQLKQFMERTLDPLTHWLERRFTLRFSVMATYLLSVVLTIFSSLGAFVSQFYVVQLLYLPIVQLLFALVKLPFLLAFDTVYLVASTAASMIGLAFHVVHVLVMAPLVFVVNVSSLRETVAVVAPVAVQGTSLSMKWWKAWSEFWETVASPMKNAVRAWWDSMLHISTSAARRETSIRRWYTPKAERLAEVLSEAQDVMAINTHLWWADMIQPGLYRHVLLALGVVYLYWLFLGISETVWDDFLYASGVRHPPDKSPAGSLYQPHTLREQQLQQHRAARGLEGAGSCIDTPTTATMPASAVLHILFQHPYEQLAAAAAGLVTSTIATASTPAQGSLEHHCGALPRALLSTPTSVIHMCDSAGTSTITTITYTATRTIDVDLGEAPQEMTYVTTFTTVLPLPQVSLSAMAAELLLPNAVLSSVQQVTHLLWGGWRTLADLVATRRARSSLPGRKAGAAATAFDNATTALRCDCAGSSKGDSCAAPEVGASSVDAVCPESDAEAAMVDTAAAVV